MRYLLDTHTFLWWVADSAELSDTVRTLIGDVGNEVMFSVVSAWEIAIKYSIGRLSLSKRPREFVQEQLRKVDFQVLPIRLEHSLEAAELPALHSDPFDRLLVAQCRCDNLTLMSRDTHLARYPIRVLW